ncbi:hypothetical protein TA05_10755 [Citrobacter rodentium]|nr:hypothetical protein TA05_10755 [Citrobacter rodentium]
MVCSSNVSRAKSPKNMADCRKRRQLYTKSPMLSGLLAFKNWMTKSDETKEGKRAWSLIAPSHGEEGAESEG